MNDFNSYGDEAAAGVQPLFFRVADRMRLEGYVAALIDDNMSLSLVSSHDAILDHYGKLLVARLREAAPHMGLEVYFPASAEALIARFNEVLQAYSIEDAMGTKAPVAPPKIWIVHDASSLPDHEIQLLARLVQHFPAANIRVVMLLTTASKKQQLLASFGRRILNWEIEPPSTEQAQVLLEEARAQGRERAVGALLKKITPWHSASTAPVAIPVVSALAPVAAQTAEPVMPTAPQSPAAPARPEASAQTKEKTKGSLKKALLWLAGIVGLLAACAVAVLMLYGSEQTAALLGIGTSTAPEPPPTSSVPIPAAAPVAPAPADTPVPPASADPAPAPMAAPPGATNALGAGAAAATAPAKAAEPAATAAPRSSSVVAPTEIEEIITPAQAQVGQAWVRQMPPGTFMVQHTIVPSYGEATLWLQAHPNLRRARIVATYLNGQKAVQFTVVSGPFASLAEANTFASGSGIPKDPQIRSARSMKDRFAP
jgi:hypothetical protein